jgi:hypothetical protein
MLMLLFLLPWLAEHSPQEIVHGHVLLGLPLRHELPIARSAFLAKVLLHPSLRAYLHYMHHRFTAAAIIA